MCCWEIAQHCSSIQARLQSLTALLLSLFGVLKTLPYERYFVLQNWSISAVYDYRVENVVTSRGLKMDQWTCGSPVARSQP